jgi:BA14K-like protein
MTRLAGLAAAFVTVAALGAARPAAAFDPVPIPGLNGTSSVIPGLQQPQTIPGVAPPATIPGVRRKPRTFPDPPVPDTRLEMHSYQPYSGLQFGFRPDPPANRTFGRKPPQVIMPEPVAPLIEYGRPTPYSQQWYVYCADRYRSFEPETGLYTTYSGANRTCR